MSLTTTDEILSIIRYAPGPIGAAGIYEQCKQVEDMNNLSSRLSQLHKAGRIVRHEITTINNRKAFAYTLPGASADGGAEPAAGQSATPVHGSPPSAPQGDALSLGCTAGKAVRQRKPPKDSVAAALDGVEASLAAAKSAPQRESAAADPAAIADGMLARARHQLGAALRAPLSGGVGITTAPGSITINVERVEIHINIGVASPVTNHGGRPA
jgi:hypothetical protein